MESGGTVVEGTKLTVKIESQDDAINSLLLNGNYTGTSGSSGVTSTFIASESSMNFSIVSESIEYAQNPASAVLNKNHPDQNVLYDNGVYYRAIWTIDDADGNNQWTIGCLTDLSDWADNSKWTYHAVVNLNEVFGSTYVSGTHWAPDLIRIGNKYYLTGTIGLTGYSTYYGTQYATIVIFESDSPTGTYKLISRQNNAVGNSSNKGLVAPSYGTALGGITPQGWNSIDSTIYVENGVPYLLWSDEWNNYSNKAGNYYYAKLSDDLSMLAETPKLLFTPSKFNSAHGTTDAVWLHKAASGDLLAVYTSYDSKSNYCVHYARSSNGLISGSWSYVGELYSKTTEGLYLNCANPNHNYTASVGGHANTFKTIDGQIYLILHLHMNNNDGVGTGGWREPAIIALKETGSYGSTKLVWGVNDDKYIVQDISSDPYMRLAAGSIGEVNVAFTVNMDETVRGGVQVTYTDGSQKIISVGFDGKVYVNDVLIGSVTAADKYSFRLDYKTNLSSFTFTVNGIDLSAAAKAQFTVGTVRFAGLRTTAAGSATNGKAAYQIIGCSMLSDGGTCETSKVPEFSSETKNAVMTDYNRVSITNNGYAYFEGGGSAVYLKVTFNISNDHQGITIYTDSVDGNNAQICFQHKGFSLLQDYAYTATSTGNIFSNNGLLGIDTSTAGEHTVEYFIIDGKLYVIYDGVNCFDKPLTLSALNAAFTADATYHIGIYNYENNKNVTLENTEVQEIMFGADATNKYNCTNGDHVDKNGDEVCDICGEDIPVFSNESKNASFVNKNTVTITGNGYAYLKGSDSAVYLKVKLNITNDFQGITIYTDSVDGNNAQIGFHTQGYGLLQGYGWNNTATGDKYSHNKLLGIDTTTKGEHTVEYFIIDGKLYVIYDGVNCFDKPLTLSELNSAFTADATYHIGIYNYDGNKTLENTEVQEIMFGDEARNAFEAH